MKPSIMKVDRGVKLRDNEEDEEEEEVEKTK